MGKSAPKAPDYQAAAEEQARSSREVTNIQNWANRPTQITPFGRQDWSTSAQIDPATGQPVTAWTQSTTLTPESQRALDAQLGLTASRSELGASLMPRAEDEFRNPMDWSSFEQRGERVNPEDLVRSIEDTGRYWDDAENAIYGKFASRMDPRFARDKEQLQTRLYAQGLREGDEAYTNAMTDFEQNKNDAYEQAAYQATIGAGQEASRYQGMDVARGAFANQAAQQAFDQNRAASSYATQLRQQDIAEEMQRRGFSLNEINAILTGQQVGLPGMPGFTNASRSEGVQSLSAAQMQGQSALDAYNAEQAATQGILSGVGSLAGGAMMFSDRKLKKNIVEWTYDAIRGLQGYFFNYIWEKDTDPLHYGFMADDVEKLYPHAVITVCGFKAVNYGSL